ncbi:MAG TPA: sigma-70 family RNA polymerase sigma factor [Thermoanaerobaculia bacterium]|nr:sigma-70 family RNA polymerase sigma factor [Thermoanaerobaculia bacterium]
MSNVAAFRMSDIRDIPSDQDLVERTLAGDGDAYGMLVERHQRKIYRVAFAIVRDPSEADSVTQDAFVQAFTHLTKFEGRSGFETWLTRIAINRSRDSLRRRRFVSLFRFQDDEEGENEPILELVDERPNPERQLISSQLRVSIERAERQLSAQQKVIFRLRHYENLPLEEIAEHLGLSAGTVRAHLFRAIHKVRRELSVWRSNPRIQHEPALQ